MRAENTEQIREHLARGGRVIYGNQRIVEAVTATGRVLLGFYLYPKKYCNGSLGKRIRRWQRSDI